MSQWKPEIDHHKGPRYIAIADAIGDAIRDGTLKPHERLPTHRDLAYDLGVTVGTVSRAYGEAVRRDYVIGEVGRGTYVKPVEEVQDILFHIPDDKDPNLIDFSMNIHTEGEGVEVLRKALMVLAQDPGLGALMRYQGEQGMEHHRVSMAKWAQMHGTPYDPDRIIMSCGVQHAMMLALMALMKPGDTLLCEEYSYPGIKTLATQLGVKMHGLPMDEEGLIPDHLEGAIMQTGARVLYCMPNYQNPTSANMSLKRRREIVDIAQRQGLWIVEDGTAEYFMNWHRREAACRQEIMLKHITRGQIKRAPNTYHTWFHLPKPWMAEMFCLRARERNVSIMSSNVFYIGKGTPINAARICFGSPPNREMVEDGMSRLAQLLSEEIHAFHNVM
jgi:DNA-binding transcriptional MocR family regulator